MQLRVAVAIILLLLSTLAWGNERTPGKEAIQRILLDQRHWTLINETGPGSQPSAAAQSFAHAFYLRDGRLMGEWAGRPPPYDCPYEVKLRDDGFAFFYCRVADQPRTGPSSAVYYIELQYEFGDARYPFKRISAPSKWWLEKRNQ
jgi:hypothetical protein